MAIIPLVEFPNPALKKIAEPVGKVDEAVRKLLSDMADTMYDAPGIGLAAPQIGISRRIIVVDVNWREQDRHPRGYVNPEIVFSEGAMAFDEGCLSVPGFQSEVKRASRVVVKALDPDGKPVEIAAEGLEAVCFQHEVDHLNGMLFIDRISRLKRGLYVKRRKKELAQG
ncbi:MAG: peptide deformylase [Myxococcota bacterium]